MAKRQQPEWAPPKREGVGQEPTLTLFNFSTRQKGHMVQLRTNSIRCQSHGSRANLFDLRYCPSCHSKLLWVQDILRYEHHRHRRQNYQAGSSKPPVRGLPSRKTTFG